MDSDKSQKSVVYVTGNPGKVSSLKSRLEPAGIVVDNEDHDLPEIQSMSLQEITVAKAKAAFFHTRRPTVVLDAGFYLKAFEGFPGPFTKQILKGLGLGGFLDLMEKQETRDCYFEDCLGYIDPSLDEPILFTSRHKGSISRDIGEVHPGKKSWSDLHRVFIPNYFENPLSAMDDHEAKQCSDSYHSNSYAAQFIAWFKDYTPEPVRRIEKRIWPKYFQMIIDGKKKFELRLNNFDCKPGDILVLHEWNPASEEYTGRVLEKKATYIIKTRELPFWPIEDTHEYGYQVISFD